MSTIKKSSYFILAGLSLANLLGCVDLTSINVALPIIKKQLALPNGELQWVSAIVLLALSSLMVVMGKMADNFGRKIMLFSGFAILLASSICAGLSNDFITLLCFRFLQGIAIAILYTAPVALIPEIFAENTGKAMGVLFGVSGVGLTIGPIIGGYLTQIFSWHAVFFINVPFIIIAALLCATGLPNKRSEKNNKMDILGSILLILSLITLVYATVNGNPNGWLSYKTLGLYAISAALIVTFILQEKKTAEPIMDFKLFNNKRFVAAALINFILSFFYAVDLFFIPLHLHNSGHFTDEQIGLLLMTATVMVAIFSPLSGNLYNRFGAKTLLGFGCTLLTVSALLQIFVHNGLNLNLIIVSYALFGISWAFILTPSITTAMSSLPESMGGTAIGSIGVLHNLGGVAGLAIGSTMIYQNAMTMLAITSFISICIATFGLTTKHGNTNELNATV